MEAKPLTNLTKTLGQFNPKGKSEDQISKIRTENREVTTESNKIQIIRAQFQNLYSQKLKNLDKVEKPLDMYDPLKLNKMGYKHLQHTQEHQRDCNSIRLSPQKQNKQTWTKGTEVNSSKPSKESSYQ